MQTRTPSAIVTFFFVISIFLQLSFFRDVDIIFGLLMVLIFFFSYQSAIFFGVLSSLIIGFFSPLFGVRALIILFVMSALFFLSQTVFTNRSFGAFIFLGMIGWASMIFFGGSIEALLALFIHNENLFPIFGIQPLLSFLRASAFQAILLLFLYWIFRRKAPSESFSF